MFVRENQCAKSRFELSSFELPAQTFTPVSAYLVLHLDHDHIFVS